MLASDDILTLDDLIKWEKELAAAERELVECRKRVERLDKLIVAGRVLWPRDRDGPEASL